MNEFIVDFQVTKNCNLNCQFCCGADKSKKDVNIDTIESVINKLALAGVDRIVLTGGEPLIRNDIDKIIKYIKERNINIYLSTNGYFLMDHLKVIDKNIDCIGLPLDGYYENTNAKMTRKNNQKKITLESIKMIKQSNPNIIVKVGTVVSKINIEELEQIGNLLFKSKNMSPDVWRLYQFTPLGVGKNNYKKFEIMDEKFYEVVKKLKNKFSNYNIGSLSNEESNDTYVFIAPNMDVVCLTNDNYVTLGNACEMNVDDIKMLKKNLNKTLISAKKNRSWTINE